MDRATRALYKLALSPIAETTADPNSYGFRACRSCADAVAAAFNALSKPNSATWVLEGDIKGCFDNINHQWMLENIAMDKVILGKWLRAGYMDDGVLYPSRKGTPQGGIISPTLANMALDGLERVISESVPRRSRVNFVRYADDFIVTGKSRRILEERVIPAIEAFLSERGLSLSKEKTSITYIKRGFTFLAQTFRKRGGKLRITPSSESVLSLKRKVGKLIRGHVSAPLEPLIKKLNQTLRGWGNYHRYVVSSEAFSSIDDFVYQRLWRMIRRRHRKKSKTWLSRKYWSLEKSHSIFSVKSETSKGTCLYRVIRLGSLGIQRYIKIKAKANPYDPAYAGYIWRRQNRKGNKIFPARSSREFRARFAT